MEIVSSIFALVCVGCLLAVLLRYANKVDCKRTELYERKVIAFERIASCLENDQCECVNCHKFDEC